MLIYAITIKESPVLLSYHPITMEYNKHVN